MGSRVHWSWRLRERAGAIAVVALEPGRQLVLRSTRARSVLAESTLGAGGHDFRDVDHPGRAGPITCGRISVPIHRQSHSRLPLRPSCRCQSIHLIAAALRSGTSRPWFSTASTTPSCVPLLRRSPDSVSSPRARRTSALKKNTHALQATAAHHDGQAHEVRTPKPAWPKSCETDSVFRIAIINSDKVRHVARSPANPAVAEF